MFFVSNLQSSSQAGRRGFDPTRTNKHQSASAIPLKRKQLKIVGLYCTARWVWGARGREFRFWRVVPVALVCSGASWTW
jgi:hypothetical protein